MNKAVAVTEQPLVAVLTGGGDRPYALGFATSLAAEGLLLDFIGSDEHQAPEISDNPAIRFLNLQGEQRPGVGGAAKVRRLIAYYLRLLRYCLNSQAPIFHILWNNRLEWLDRTLLHLFYQALGKRVVLTVHNVNREARDGKDSLMNRATLRFQYSRSEHLFVHTHKMKSELVEEYSVAASRITVIPFGINCTVPDTALTQVDARRHLGLSDMDMVVLFFGNIAPYKGLHYLVEALRQVAPTLPECRLVIAGRPKPASYWKAIQTRISQLNFPDRVIQRIEYIPDDETEVYFKAADVLALPYVHVYQSGVLSLAYYFGLPVIASDVGSLREDILDSVTGCVCRPCDAGALASAIQRFFASDLYQDRVNLRRAIRRLARERYSWKTVANITADIYGRLMSDAGGRPQVADRGMS